MLAFDPVIEASLLLGGRKARVAEEAIAVGSCPPVPLDLEVNLLGDRSRIASLDPQTMAIRLVEQEHEHEHHDPLRDRGLLEERASGQLDGERFDLFR